MEPKIFLGKYRVTADEVALAEVAPATVAVATTQHLATARIYRGEEIDPPRRSVTVEVMPAGAFKPTFREKLQAEADEGKKISHLNIPALYDFGIVDDEIIYVTEYFDGASAEEWVNEHGPMPTGAVLRIALQIIAAMGAASFYKISHHAINPANVILVPGQTPEGDWPLVKVLHFLGAAPTFAASDMSVAAFDKSSHYASPEQLQGRPVDFRSEIYSLGATMWFLLTGAPPLMAPKGPLAMQPTTTGLAVDKLKGMPKRVRRLISQMLSVDPTARPQDALAFYRQVQECIEQVDRRESMARKLGVPFLASSNVVAPPKPRRASARMLALAAVIIGFVTLSSVLLANYFRHQRVRQAEEPIGVPIGVPDANASAAPAIVSAPTVAPAPPRPLPENTAPAATAPEREAPSKNESAPVVAANNTHTPNDNNPPPSSEATKAAPNEPASTEEKSSAPPPTIANNDIANNEPKTLEEKPFASEPPKIAANEPKVVDEKPIASEPKKSARTQLREEKSERPSEVAVARPVSPEVRRAQPAPPSEGPEEAPPPLVKKERMRKPRPEVDGGSIPRAVPAEPNEEVFPSQAPQVQQLPRGRSRAKFIGVTADGNWMFALPNKKIVIVPAPPGG